MKQVFPSITGLVLTEQDGDDVDLGVRAWVVVRLIGPTLRRLWLMGSAAGKFRLEFPGDDDLPGPRTAPTPFTGAAHRAVEEQVFRHLERISPPDRWHELHLLGMARTRRQREEDCK